MTDDERARAFDRFWQSAPARREGRPNGHFGLGLPIVRELVGSDGGQVALERSAAGGLEVVVLVRRRTDGPPARSRQLSAVSSSSGG